jgi:hypothetical protein
VDPAQPDAPAIGGFFLGYDTSFSVRSDTQHRAGRSGPRSSRTTARRNVTRVQRVMM